MPHLPALFRSVAGRIRARLCHAGMAVALVGTLAACVDLSPRYERPAAPVPTTYPQDTAAADASGDGAEPGWSRYFTDPQLQALIRIALANNRDLRMAALRTQEARAAYAIQRADQFPTVGVGAQAARARTPGDLNMTGEPLVGGDYEAYVGISSWELDLWGRVRNLKQSALQDYLASEAAQHGVRVSLIAQVADGYLQLRELDERLALTRQTIDSRLESFRIFKRRYEVGAISKLDLTQVETLLNQAQSLSAQLEQMRASQAHALQQLAGTTLELAQNDRGFDDGAVLAGLPPGLPSSLLTRRPDLMAAEHRLRAAHANIGAARAAFFPRIALTGTWGTASAELDGLFDSGSRAWTFVPTLSLPIFDGGRRRAGLDLAEVRRDLAVADYEKTVQTAFREVSDALSARRWLAEQVRIQRETLLAQAERARLARLRYDNGASPYLEVLDAQRDLLSAQQALVQTRRALLSSEVALYAALGGGANDAAADSSAPYAVHEAAP
jgi:multidrug efflux system outer membrane protein